MVKGINELLTNANKFVDELAKPFVGREEEAKAIALAIISGEHIVLIGEPGCVTGDTIIASEDGRLFYIEDIAKNLIPGVYIADFPVFPPGHADQLHIYDVWETIEIRTRHGFILRGTPNHPVMTPQGWKELRGIRPGDKVLVYTRIPSPKHYIEIPLDKEMQKEKNAVKSVKILDERLGEILGVYTSRGMLGKGYIGFKIGVNEGKLRRRIYDLMKELFDVEPAKIMVKNSRISRVIYRSSYLAKLFKLLDHSRGMVRRVSRWILLSPKNVSASFLRGLFEGSAKLSTSRRDKNYSIVLRSKSLELLKGVQILLLRHGILSKINSLEKRSRRYGKTYTYHMLKIDGYENLEKFHREIGFISEEKNEKLMEAIKILNESGRDKKITSGNGYIYDTVREVRRINGWTRVYDFHVEKTHSFFTNGLLSHNTAKSALARRAAELINARFFKYLLTKFTEPDELFGPLDINALKQGRYVRITRNKLPEAEIAFIDEIFNANSAILNMFLTIMNERIVYDGYNEIRVPLWTMIAASNNVPDEPELQALYDRFLYRHFVKPVSEDKWADLIEAAWKIEAGYYEAAEPILNMEDIRNLNKLLFEVNLEPVKEKLIRLYAIFEDQGIHITDRRKGKALKAIAASALLDKRLTAKEEDLFVLKFVAPRDAEEMEQAYAILLDEIKATEKHLKELAEIEANVREAKAYIVKITDFDPRLVDYLRSFESVRERVRKIAEETSDDVVRQRALDVMAEINDVIELIRRKFMI